MTDNEWGVFFELLEKLVYGDGRPLTDKVITVARKAEELDATVDLLEFLSWAEEISQQIVEDS